MVSPARLWGESRTQARQQPAVSKAQHSRTPSSTKPGCFPELHREQAHSPSAREPHSRKGWQPCRLGTWNCTADGVSSSPAGHHTAGAQPRHPTPTASQCVCHHSSPPYLRELFCFASLWRPGIQKIYRRLKSFL